MPRKRNTDTIANVAQQVRAKREAVAPAVPSRLCLPTGSTLLNLAVSDDAFGGWGAGKVVNLVGDSNTGKTLLVLTGLMEMAMDPQFEGYRFVYDDAENALEMPVHQMFGDAVADRLEDPYGAHYGEDDWRSSESIEDVKNNIWALLEEDTPFIYILDSYDAVTTRDELKRQAEEAKGKELNKDYPRGPAILGQMLRLVKGKLRNTKSLVLIISQTRDVIDAGSFAATKRRAGGRALKFYSSHEVWLAVAEGGQIKQEVRGQKHTIGWNIRVRSERSKLNGKRRDVPMTCYTEYGVDDIGANIDWLMKAGAWSGTKAKIVATGLLSPGGCMSRTSLINWIEGERKERKLRLIVQKAWDDIEGALKMTRRKRFE